MLCRRCQERPVFAKGECSRCYYATRRSPGRPTRLELRRARNFLRGGVGVLTTADGTEFCVDPEDFERCAEYLWSLRNGYAYARKAGYLHRFVRPGLPLVDHEDRDPKNNRRSNLRDGTGGVNSRNSAPRSSASGYRGVSRMRTRWQAAVVIHGVKYRGGTFDTPEEAAQAVHQIAQAHGMGEAYPPP